jgi:hypothetical protein
MKAKIGAGLVADTHSLELTDGQYERVDSERGTPFWDPKYILVEDRDVAPATAHFVAHPKAGSPQGESLAGECRQAGSPSGD